MHASEYGEQPALIHASNPHAVCDIITSSGALPGRTSDCEYTLDCKCIFSLLICGSRSSCSAFAAADGRLRRRGAFVLKKPSNIRQELRHEPIAAKDKIGGQQLFFLNAGQAGA